MSTRSRTAAKHLAAFACLSCRVGVGARLLSGAPFLGFCAPCWAVYLTTRIKEVAGDVKVLLDAMEPQQVVNNKVSETEQLTGTMKKQIRELWQSLEGVRNEFGEFSQEQKMVLGFLDTQQKTKFGILQKDVSNLLTLYGTSSTQ
eukprot:g6049.t1